MSKRKLAIYRSRGGTYFVHPEGTDPRNNIAAFPTREEAEAYIKNPPPEPNVLDIRIDGLDTLGGKLAKRLHK